MPRGRALGLQFPQTAVKHSCSTLQSAEGRSVQSMHVVDVSVYRRRLETRSILECIGSHDVDLPILLSAF